MEGYDDQEPGGVRARPRHRKGDTAAMVAVLARGGTQQEAGDAAGLSVREVRRRMREPDVERLLGSARREHQRQMMAKLGEGGPEAVAVLCELMGTDQPVETRFKAARELLRAALHSFDRVATREELDDLQAQLDALLSPDASELDQ
jgi:hypothetical protein